MTDFEEYGAKYRCLRMERDGGILRLTLNTDGGPFRWGLAPHEELPRAFADIGADCENRVVVITGEGETFSAPRVAHANVHSTVDPRPDGAPGR